MPVRLVAVILLICIVQRIQSTEIDFTGVPCGLPSFADKLTGEIKTKMTAIWTNAPKTNCTAQYQATLKLLHELPHNEYEEIAVHFGGVPAFMRGLAPDVIAQFEKIWHDRNLTSDAKRAKFRALAKQKLNDKQIAEFEAFERATDAKHEAFEAKLAALSTEARTAYDTLLRLKHDERELLKSIPDADRRQIFQLPSKSQSHHDTDSDGVPNFLENAPEQTKSVELQKLADTLLNAEQKEHFRKQLIDIDSAHDELQTAIEKLSPTARSAYDRLSALKQQEHDVIAKLSHSAAEEVKSLGPNQ